MAKKKKKSPGRPRSIKGSTIVVSYNITVAQANFIVDEAEKLQVTESEVMRGVLDYVMDQYKRVGRA